MTEEPRIHNGEGKEQSLQLMVLRRLNSPMQENETEHYRTPLIIINSKWVKNLNVTPETIKLPEEIIGCTVFDIGRSNIFLDIYFQSREINQK